MGEKIKEAERLDGDEIKERLEGLQKSAIKVKHLEQARGTCLAA